MSNDMTSGAIGSSAADRTSGATSTGQYVDPGSGSPDDSGGGYGAYSYGGGGGYGGGYGGGGGGGGSAGKNEDTQQQLDNLNAMYGQRGKDINDYAVRSGQNVRDKMEQNKKAFTAARRNNMKQIQWQPNQQKEQSTLSALRNRMGNAGYGSSQVDLMEGMARVDDMNDVSLINTWKENMDQAYDSYRSAEDDLISDLFELGINTEDELSKLRAQWWQGLTNINPKLGAKDIIDKALRGEGSTVGEGDDEYSIEGNVDLNPTEAFKEMFKTPKRPTTFNPYTRSYVRPDRDVSTYNALGDTGSANRSTAANRGYLDNLDAYKRRV